MPGPGVELIGEEEIAEVMQVLQQPRPESLRQCRRPRFGAKVRTVEQEIAGLAGVRYGLGLHGGGSAGLWRLAARARDRARRRGHRAGFHVRRLDLGDRLRAGDAGPGRGRRLVQPRSGRRRGADHAADAGDHRRPHARRAGAARRARRRSPIATASRSSRTAPRRSVPRTRGRGSAASAPSASTASTSTRPSPAATAA